MNFNKMCRVCGEIIKEKHSETVADNKDQIYKYLPIIKESDDGSFPKNMCVDCFDLIDSWDSFYKRCEKTQKKFATLLLKHEKIIPKIVDRKDKSSPIQQDKEKADGSPQQPEDKELSKQTPKKTTNGNFSCSFCPFSSNGPPEEANDHLIAMHCDLVFCCDLCKNYKPRDDLITHMTEHALSSLQTTPEENHQPKTDKLQCPKCEKQFTSTGGLKYHMNSNHSLKQFPCDECQRVFPTKRVLQNHFRGVHSKDKPFKCNDCGKYFKTESTLYAHRKTHSKETPHKCFDCGKGFKFKHHLDSHALQHASKTKEKAFECNFCHKKFAALDNLSKHRKIHDNNTSDFACHICGIKLVQKRYLKDHMKRAHEARLD